MLIDGVSAGDGGSAADAIRRDYDVPIVCLNSQTDLAAMAQANAGQTFADVGRAFDERDLAMKIELARSTHQNEGQIRQQQEWLRVTLNSIGDAVIATDADGRMSFLNPVAESLTGWKAEEAVGQPFECVFRIVNELTGETAEDPVARVLREGRSAGLANHAALMNKDGSKVPIEDSSSPILDARGKVIGAVVVFHDVTEKRCADEEKARLAAIVESSDDAIVSKTLMGIIMTRNEGAERVSATARTRSSADRSPCCCRLMLGRGRSHFGPAAAGTSHRTLRDGSGGQGRPANRRVDHRFAGQG